MLLRRSMVVWPLRSSFDGLRATGLPFFSSLPTGGVRWVCVMAGRGLYAGVIKTMKHLAVKPLPPLPEGRNRAIPGFCFSYLS